MKEKKNFIIEIGMSTAIFSFLTYALIILLKKKTMH